MNWLFNFIYRIRHRRERRAMFARVDAYFRAAGIDIDR